MFHNRYRIESARLPGWDYTRGWYFITICTNRRRPFFGRIIDGQIALSPTGAIVAEEWHRTAIVRPYVTLDAWVVMPNHFHGIIGIHVDDDDGVGRDDVHGVHGVETARRAVSTNAPNAPNAPNARDDGNVRGDGDDNDRRPSMLHPGSLGAIVGQFKSQVTRRARERGDIAFAWQERFYDVIIRDARAMAAIRRYILLNPARWHRDRNR
jgi:REP element-mobilizing transposase RayT